MKHILLFIVMALSMLSLHAQTVLIDDISIKAGETKEVSINLTNSQTNIVSFQMDLTLPEGITINKAKCALGSRITDTDQKLTIGKQPDGSIRLTSTSFTLTPLSGSSGEIVRLSITAAYNAKGGTASLNNIRLATSDSERLTPNALSFKVNVQYTLTYNVDGMNYSTSQVVYGTVLTPESEPTKEGYTFSGWIRMPESMPAMDVIVYGLFSINKYKLTYYVDDVEYKSFEIEYGSKISIEPIPQKEGYTFSGWSEIPATMPAGDVTVKGSFIINSYTLTYILDDEIYKTSTVIYGTTIKPESVPDKAGYLFSGWNGLPQTMPADDVVVTGQYLINPHKLIYKVDGKEYKTYMLEYQTTITPEPNPYKEGYTFSGWSKIPEFMPDEDVEITGSFTVNKHLLSYLVNNNAYKIIEVEYGTIIMPESYPEKEGYTFSGWSDIPETMPDNDVVVKGTVTINKHILTYIVDNEIYSSSEIEYGTSITPEPNLQKEGYSFSGWSDIPKTMPDCDVVVLGSFIIITSKLTYIVDGEIYKTFEVAPGASIDPEKEPTKEGYTFSGWSEIPAEMPKNNVPVTGQFSINQYNITYLVDGEVYKTESVDYGIIITPPQVPSIDGFIFAWDYYPKTVPSNDISITGRYVQIAIEVKLNLSELVLKEGKNEHLIATVISDYPEYKEVFWISSDEKVAKVDDNGNVTAVNAGIVWIIATSKNNSQVNDSCKVTVIPPNYDIAVVVEAKRSASDVMDKLGEENANDVVKLTIKGSMNGWDVVAMRNKMPNLRVLDLSEALIVANSYKYYENYATKDNVLTAYFVPRGIREISLPKNLKSIDGSAFRDCAQLTSVTLPDNITSIGAHTFDGCSALTDVKIPTSVASIGEYAFKGCEALAEIHLPAYLEAIGDNAFEGCSSLKNIYALMFDIIPIGQHTFNDYNNQALFVPDFLRSKYIWDARWSQFQNIQTMELNPGDYERLTTNTDTQMGEDDQRIPHKDDGEAIDARIQREGSFTVEGDEPQDFATVELVNDGEGRSGSLIGDDDGEEQGNVVVDDLVYRVSVEAETEFQYTPPVDLNVDKDFEYPEGQYKWWYFDGSDRAKFGSSGRKALDGKMLHAHQGYVFMAQRAGTLVIHLGNTAVGGSRKAKMNNHEADAAQDEGWNFMGNPYASFYDMSESEMTAPITVWNAKIKTYEALRPGDDECHLQPFQAFYVQKPEEVEEVGFETENRESYRKSIEEKEERRALRRAKGVNPERRFIDLYIEASGQQADHTRLVANASAKAEYEIGVDAAKFMSEKAAAQIYTIESGVEMAINERPLSGSLPLGYTAAKAGRLTIGASRMDAPLVLVDRQTGVTCDLSESAYEFTTTEGTFNDRFLIRAQGDDGIGALAEKTGVLIAIREGGLAVGGAEGKEIQVYSIDGKAVATQSGNGFISLKPNIYIVGVDGITAKVRIRK